MIRINLLAADRPAAGKGKKAAAASAPGSMQAYLFLGLFGGGALLVSAALWWLKSSDIATLDEKIKAAEKRQAELQAIKVQVDMFLQKKRILDAKVKLIEQLKAQQSGPVHMLDELSKALPDFVWLTTMDQSANAIKLQGQANGLTAVADYISNLQRSGWFDKVELVNSVEQNNMIAYDLSAQFKPPQPSPSPSPAAAAPAAPAAAKP